GGIVVFDEGEAQFARTDAGARAVGGAVADGVIVAPMPGRITAVGVALGARVTSGQMLVTLEAMKMEQALVAPFDGVVAALGVVVGAQVDEGAMLVRIDKEG
ncbi:MAG: methylcrotonoyl-CoA carboxylase, partial [Sphingomonas bacterium]|nr:methylcrotonoyl-CoA carboxylase [Sphingomonas bacterium]